MPLAPGHTLALLTLSSVLIATPGQARLSLESLPPVARVTAEITAATPIETAARQMGAFWQLRQIVETFAGERRWRNQLTAEERRLIGEYSLAYQRAGEPYANLKGTPEGPKFYQMHAFYEVDDGFRIELIERFLSPALRGEYLRLKGISDAQWLARSEAARRERERVQADTQRGSSPKPVTASAPPANPYQREEQLIQSLLEALMKSTTELANAVAPPASSSSGSPNARGAVDELNRAKERHLAKDYPAAIAHARKSIALFPSGHGYLFLGRVQLESQAYADALESLSQVARVEPAYSADAQVWIGRAYQKLGQNDKAEAAWRDVLRLRPDHLQGLNELGLFLYGARRYPEALDTMLQLTRLYPKEALHWMGLGFVYVAVERKADAMQAYEKAEALDKGFARDLLERINKMK